MTDSIFTRIINGQIPYHKIYEDDLVIAFLDINPVRLGHTLIVPKIQVDYFVDVPSPYYEAVFNLAQKLAPAIQKALGLGRIGLSVVGTEVPHFHLHLIEIIDGGLEGLRVDIDQSDLEQQALLINKVLVI
jgi:histidine triad (HIT) family protein